MNPDAQRENARMLARLMGIPEEEAVKRLDLAAAVTLDPADHQSRLIAGHLAGMLRRTIATVVQPHDSALPVAVEVVIGSATPRFDVPRIYVRSGRQKVRISSAAIPAFGEANTHPIGLLIAACYACGKALKAALGDVLPLPVHAEQEIDLTAILGDDLSLLDRPFDFGDCFLAGAGAIGNGFVMGLACFDARGRLYVCDDDLVSGGNLQRCLFFTDAHINLPKAECLCTEIAALLPGVTAVPRRVRLQHVPERQGASWLGRLVVGVDSPRARRMLQGEIPGEVFDASTTGVSEIVMHFHRQPTTKACLSCVYHESPDENARERHVAESLGVTLADVREGRVSPDAAARICIRLPQLMAASITGQAYDTLFKKEICSTTQLMSADGEQVLTPFAFVSVLAGAVQALEFARRVQRGHDGLFNEWRISPWASMNFRRRRILDRRPNCEFCGNPVLAQFAAQCWPRDGADALPTEQRTTGSAQPA